LPPLPRPLHYKTPPQNFEDPGSVSNDVSKKRGRGRAWFLDDLDLDLRPEAGSQSVQKSPDKQGVPGERTTGGRGDFHTCSCCPRRCTCRRDRRSSGGRGTARTGSSRSGTVLSTVCTGRPRCALPVSCFLRTFHRCYLHRHTSGCRTVPDTRMQS